MQMRRWQLGLTTVLAVAFICGTTLARPGHGGGGPGGGGPGGIGPIVTGSGSGSGNNKPPPDYHFTGEWAEMVDVAKFNDQQKEGLHKLLLQREQTVKDCDDKQAAATKDEMAAKTDAETKVAQDKLQAIDDLRQKIDPTVRSRAFDLMNPGQKSDWTTYKMVKFFTDELSSLDPKLTDKQTVQLKAICDIWGDKILTPDVAGNATLLDGVRKDLDAKVLTDEQKKAYAQILKDKADKAAAKLASDKAKPDPAKDKPKPDPVKDKAKPEAVKDKAAPVAPADGPAGPA